jgi:hypothetical protein
MKKYCISLTVLACFLATGDSFAVRDPGPPKKRPAPVVKIKADPDPGNLTTFQNQVGKSFFFEVTGNTTGPIWGTGIYTSDSRLATAVVHAGILGNGQKGIVKVTILAGQAAYVGSTSNGVTSNGYLVWGGSYQVEPVGKT